MTLILPDIFIEAGFTPANPVQPALVIRLNSGTAGLLNTNILAVDNVWYDLTSDVISFAVNRPSTRQQGPLYNYQAGTATILLDNSAGTYDPDNAASPFAGLLAPMIPLRVRANFGSLAYPVYSGFTDGWFPADVTYSGDYAELTVSATDGFKVLAGINLPAVTITGVSADTGARVKDILTRAGWYTSAEKQLVDTGSSTLQGTTLGSDALSIMQLAIDSEIGQLYINGAGAVVFRARRALVNDTRSNTVQAVFGDIPGTVHSAGTELACSTVSRAIDDTLIANDIQATRTGGALQEVQDTASQARYLFPRTYSRTDLILQDDLTTLNWAQWVLYVGKTGESRINSITIDPHVDPFDLWPQVLGREIGDRIQIWERPAGVASPLTKDCFISGISHDWNTANATWRTTFTLQDATKYGSFLTLDNPTLGQIDHNAFVF